MKTNYEPLEPQGNDDALLTEGVEALDWLAECFPGEESQGEHDYLRD